MNESKRISNKVSRQKISAMNGLNYWLRLARGCQNSFLRDQFLTMADHHAFRLALFTGWWANEKGYDEN